MTMVSFSKRSVAGKEIENDSGDSGQGSAGDRRSGGYRQRGGSPPGRFMRSLQVMMLIFYLPFFHNVFVFIEPLDPQKGLFGARVSVHHMKELFAFSSISGGDNLRIDKLVAFFACMGEGKLFLELPPDSFLLSQSGPSRLAHCWRAWRRPY